MLGTHHDRFETSLVAFITMTGVFWVPEVYFSGKNFHVKPKFGTMEEQVLLDPPMARPVRHSIWVVDTRDYQNN